MKRILVATVMYLSMACSTPDGGDVSKLVAAVDRLSQNARARIVQYAMNRRAIDFFMDRKPNERVGWVECFRPDGSYFVAGEMLVQDVMLCLSNPVHTYRQCVAEMLQSLADELPTIPEAHDRWGDFNKCEPHVSGFYDERVVDDELLDPEAWDSEEIARAVLSFPGPPVQMGTSDPALAAAMAELVTAIRVLAPVLCALDADHWGCDTDTVDQGGDQ